MTSSKNTKRALLASVLSVVLCVAMLIGSTFAWFTDSVTSGRNKIVAGNLDVELYNTTNDENGVPVGPNDPLFDSNLLWEPGHVEYVNLRVANVGTLTLQYAFGINIYDQRGAMNVEGNYFELSDYIQFAVVEGRHTYSKTNYGRTQALADAEATAAPISNMDAKMNGDLQPKEVQDVTLIVFMPEKVGNEANYAQGEAPFIEMGVTLNATQYTDEYDGFNNQYDADAYFADSYVSTLDELKDALEKAQKGDVIALDSNITLQEGIRIPEDVTLIGKNDATVSFHGYDIAQVVTLSPGANLDSLNFVMGRDADQEGWVTFVQMEGRNAVTNCTFKGEYQLGDMETTRAILTNAGVRNFVIANNTFTNVRQAAYVEGNGKILNNVVNYTRGFVLCQNYKVDIRDNNFYGNYVDIAIIKNNIEENLGLYDDVEALSKANNMATVDNQALVKQVGDKTEVNNDTELAEALAAGDETIVLNPAVAYQGPFDVTHNTTILGNGATVNSKGGDTFKISQNVNATFSNCKITNGGNQDGIQLPSSYTGKLVVDNCTFAHQGLFQKMNHSVWIDATAEQSEIVIKNSTLARPIQLSGSAASSLIQNISILNNHFNTAPGVAGVTICGYQKNVEIADNTFDAQGFRVYTASDRKLGFTEVKIHDNFYGSTFENFQPQGDETVDEVKAAYQEQLDRGGIVLENNQKKEA